MLVLILDVTSRKAADEALLVSLEENRRAREAAEIATQTKDNFLASLSHELRTPLTPITVAVHLLQKQKDLSAKSQETLKMIQRNVDTECSLIDDLLDVTRIERGKLEIVQTPTNVHETIRHAIEISRCDIDARHQQLELHLDATQCVIQGDAVRLEQAIWNILKNAAKFTPENGVITVRTDSTEDGLVVEITDTGIGISPEDLDTIFVAFSQGRPKVTREYGGLGLGLAISRAIVKAHGGTLTARSMGENCGTTFTFKLPFA